MKTLYININNEPIQSNEELEVLKHDLDSDFFFYLGEKIAKDCKVENENALITAFNTKDNEEDYKQIITQWNEIKTILFSEECEGKIELTLPNGYIHWLRYGEKYNHVYDKNFSHGEPLVIYIDLKELYEESVEDLQRKMLRKLQRDDLYLEIDEIVFNDDAVTRKSSIIRTIEEKYESVGFKGYKKWLEENEELYYRSGPVQDDEIKANKSIEDYIKVVKKLKTYWRADLFLGGLCAFTTYNKEKGFRSGFINDEGSEVVPPTYEGYRLLSEGLTAVCLNERWGFIDKTGKEVIPCIYEKVKSFSEGLAAVYLNGKWGFIDKTGNEVIPSTYEEVISFSKGLAAVCLNEKWGFIDKTGNEVIPSTYEEFISFSEGLAAVCLNEKWGFIDKTGNEVIPSTYEEVESFSEGLAAVYLNGKWGFIDKTGNEVIPSTYEKVKSFSEGLAAVYLNGKWGFIDKTGNEVIPSTYEKVKSFSKGLAAVCLNEKWGFIDKTGTTVIPFIYMEVCYFSGLIYVKKDYAAWGLIDKTGKELIPCIYTERQLGDVSIIDDGFVRIRFKGKLGLFNQYGKQIIPFLYNGIGLHVFDSFKLIIAYNENEECYYDLNGNLIRN